MNVANLPAVRGARHRRKRLGRGIGSGHGKTSTRGQKGQRARTGEGKRPGFEGGRNPLIRSIPKRGGKDKSKQRGPRQVIVNVGQLERCPAGERLTPERLTELGFIPSADCRVKLLGDGTLTKRLDVLVHAASANAKEKIAQAGGRLEVLQASAAPHAA